MSANVNHPTNIKEKEADVNRKLQLYGIVNAFQNGKVPSNEQIDVALNSFLASKALSSPPNKLSDEGKVLVQDVRDVVEQAKQLLLSKNEGNLLQDFIWQTTQFDPKAVSTPNAPVSKESAQRDGDEALQGLRTLGTLLITNGQFRKLLNDATTLLRDIAGDTATHAAQKVRPSDEDLQQMDRPAADNTWHEKPDLSKENIKQQAQGIYGGNPKQDAKDVAQSAQNAAVPDQGASHPNQVDQNAGKNEAKNAVQNKIDQRVDPETKDKAKEAQEAYKQRAKNYFNKKMPEERKDQIIWRLKKMILECQQHPDYSEAIQTLLRLAENYGRHGRVLGQGAAGTAQEGRSGLANAEADLRTLIERFANGTSTAELWSGINVIYKDAEKDDELRNWFKSMNSYVRRCLLEQGYILEDESSREWDRLYEQGRYLLRDKYRTHTDRVFDEIKFIGDQFDQDPKNKAFAASLQKLFKDLGNDSEGKPTFKPHLVKDLTEVIIPAILESTAYIPIPRIEYTDNQVDAIIENLVLESDNFMPNIMEVASDNYWRWGRKKIASSHKNSMDIKVSGIQMDLRDVSYHIKKKQGFPSITDTGVADILLPGDGFSFRMKVSTAEKNDRENYFKVQKVDVDIEDLKIKLKKSNHKLLFGLFKPIMLKALRPPMQKAVEKAIKDECNKLDQLFFQIKQEADRALEEAKENPEEAPNVYQRYYNAAQKRVLQGKEKAENKVADKKVNYAVTQEDSLFPNIKLPGGISSKATEYKELARKGERWESPVFSIGQAAKSTNIPAAPKIETKTRPAQSSTGAGYGSTGAGYGTTGAGYDTTGAGYGTTGAGYGTSGAGYGDAYGSSNGGYSNGSTLGATNGNGKGPANPIGSNPVTGAPQINTSI